MHCRVFGGIAAFGLVAGAAHGSYELLLVADRGTDSIHRYDPQSRTYLGSFGGGFLQNPVGIAVNKAAGECYVIEANNEAIFVFNYSTGNLLRINQVASASPAPRLTFDGGTNLGYVGNSSGGLYNINTGAIVRSWNIPSTGAGITYDSASNRYFMVNSFNNTISTYLASSSAATGTTPAGPILFEEGDIATLRGDAYFCDNTDMLFQWSTSIGSAPIHYSTATTMPVIQGLVSGHATLYICGQLVAAGARGIMMYDPISNRYGSAFGQAQLLDPQQMAIVLAPEPGAFLALGAGAAAIVLRRRKKR